MSKQHNTEHSNKLLAKIARHYYGPYEIVAGTDGCDKTYDIYCMTTQTYLLSVAYWEDQQWALSEAKAIVAFMNSQSGRDYS